MNGIESQWIESISDGLHSMTELCLRNGMYFARVRLFGEPAVTEIALPGAATPEQATRCLSIIKAAACWTKQLVASRPDRTGLESGCWAA